LNLPQLGAVELGIAAEGPTGMWSSAACIWKTAGLARGGVLVLALIRADQCVSGAANAQTFTSAYTSTAPKDCRKGPSVMVDGDEYGSERTCPGFSGLVVRLQEVDLRGTVSVGRSRKAAAREPAASQGFGAFNSTTDTIEWRLDAKRKPIAMIQRWHIAEPADAEKSGRPKTQQVLVVTRLPPGPVCHVAYIEVKDHADANEQARKAADEQARDYDCKGGENRPTRAGDASQ
jgi:hypothetical protein